ncbi:thymopoietin a isoform X4 [Danio rerio]|uniref:Thymopoietin a isoform X4 n=1 Tax=Danio rerio TaxID=7955 RepID=A0AC58J5J5_DANRE
MSEFLEDPSVLTKDKLKSALLANNVALPNGDQRKDVYVQLYLKNLTVQNKKSSGSPDVFSSDEELPPAPVVSNRSRSGRKATRKTDKVRPDDVDVTELSNEGLKDLLLKYGLNAGPIVASTRKVYEKRLQKLLDQGPPVAVALPSETSQTDGNQNGNNDSDQYSDREEEPVAPAPVTVPEPEVEAELIPVVERPVRSRGKTPVTSRTRSGQHTREDVEEEDWPVLNVKRKLKRSSHRPDQMVPASDDTENSELSSAECFAVSEDRRRTGPGVGRRETRPLLSDRTSKLSSKSESLRRRSAPVRSVLNEASSSDKVLFSDFSEPSIVKEVSVSLMRMKVQPLTVPKDPKPSKRYSMSATESTKRPVSSLNNKHDENTADIPSPPHRQSSREPLVSLINTACVEVDDQGMQDVLSCRSANGGLLAQGVRSAAVSKLSKPVLSQSKPSKPLVDMMCCLSPSSDRQKEVEKVSAIDQTPRAVERDVLKEIFPTENLNTPTGISATCRRPIRGAAGRPLIDTWLNESRQRLSDLKQTTSSSSFSSTSSYTESRSVPRVSSIPLSASKSTAPPTVKSRSRRSLPVWVQLVLLSAVAGFLFFIYQAMETNDVGLFKQSGTDDSTSK